MDKVFSAPKSDAARRLVFPDGATDLLPCPAGERRVRVVFNGALAAGRPLITQMAIDKHIAANILAASTKCVGDKVYGNMLLSLPGDAAAVEEAIRYLQAMPDILAEEVQDHV